MNQFDEFGEHHGYWEAFYCDGNFFSNSKYKANYFHGHFKGYSEWYDFKEQLKEKVFYI